MDGKTLQHEIVDSMREIVFGLEDSLVSTLGTLTGIAVGSHSQYIVILSGLVLIASEATSMAAGSYLSTKHATEAEAMFHERHGLDAHPEPTHPIRAAVVMGVFYVFGGAVPLSCYFLLPVDQAMIPAVVLTGISLFFVGVWAASFTRTSKIKSGLEMLLVSLAAAFIGYVIGYVVNVSFGTNVVL